MPVLVDGWWDVFERHGKYTRLPRETGLPAGAVLWWRRPSPGVGTRTSSRRATGILLLKLSTAPAHEARVRLTKAERYPQQLPRRRQA
jgi:hypothetical protein